jgi:hypothetical protein
VTIEDQEAPAKEELEVEVPHGEETGGGRIALKSEYQIQEDGKLLFFLFFVKNISFIYLFMFIPMCIQCLGHFSPPPPTLFLWKTV